MGMEPISIALLTTTVVSTGVGIDKQFDAAKIQQKERAVGLNMQKAEARRKTIDQLARVRALRAQAINVAEQTGTAKSSTTAGMTDALTSSGAENIGTVNSNLNASNTMSALSQEAEDAMGSAAVFGAIAYTASVFNQAIGPKMSAPSDIPDSANPSSDVFIGPRRQ